MNVTVLFFGATAEAAGKRCVDVAVDDAATSREVFDTVLKDYPSLASHKLLFAVNQEYATGEEKLSPNDELAVFTAVSGG